MRTAGGELSSTTVLGFPRVSRMGENTQDYILRSAPLSAVTLPGEGKNRRSLHYAPPDFLLRVVALANFMRLSLRKAA